ncbi:MAG: hypothetical protein QOG20_3794, partial [Pseudonocardiales bacterium]|nr:hypothetical protein [Pseudonocardiales bacterium]
VAADARLRGATVGVVDGPDERRALLTAIGQALRFPSHYGRDLDALEECLLDLSWLPTGEVVLVWDGADALQQTDPRGHRVLLEVLASAIEATADGPRPLRVVLTGAAQPR